MIRAQDGPSAVWGGLRVESQDTSIERVRFTLKSQSGDGAFLCYKKVSNRMAEYFHRNGLSLEDYVLDPMYADLEKVPNFARLFEPGTRAEFGETQASITLSDHLILTVQSDKSDKMFSGKFPRANILHDITHPRLLRNEAKGIYAIGHEGLEDCSITGYLTARESFDINKFKVRFSLFDYTVISRWLLSEIKYSDEVCEWSLDSYEGTGDNCFEFVLVNGPREIAI